MVYHIQKKIWKHFRPKNPSTCTNNPTSEIQIVPFKLFCSVFSFSFQARAALLNQSSQRRL